MMRRGHLFLSRCVLRGARGGSPPVRERPSNRAPEFFGRSSDASETVSATSWCNETAPGDLEPSKQPQIEDKGEVRCESDTYYHNSALPYTIWASMTYVVREVRPAVMPSFVMFAKWPYYGPADSRHKDWQRFIVEIAYKWITYISHSPSCDCFLFSFLNFGD